MAKKVVVKKSDASTKEKRSYKKLQETDVAAISALLPLVDMKANRVQEALELQGKHYDLKQVQRVVSELKKGTSPSDIVSVKKGRGRKFTSKDTSKENLNKDIKNKLSLSGLDAQMTIRTLAKDLNVSKSAVSRAVKETGYHSVRKVESQVTNPKKESKRLIARNKILKWMIDNDISVDQLFFSDEKIFYPSATTAGDKNDRVFIPKDMSKGEMKGADIARPKKSREVGIMISVCISSMGGGVSTRPHIVPVNQRVDEKYYCENMLEADLVPQMVELSRQHLPGKSFYFQEDGASSHTARGTRKFLKKMNVKVLGGDSDRSHLWPANSPDLAPNDYFFWNAVQLVLRKMDPPPTDLMSLRIALPKAVAAVSPESIHAACSAFRSKLEACIENEGGIFEHKVGKK